MTSLEVPMRELAALTTRLAPRYRLQSDAPDTHAAMLDALETDGILTVWNGASGRTIYGVAEANYAFRAWHDSLHARYMRTFSVEDEYHIADIQAAQSGKLGRWIYADAAGQIAHYEAYGDFPVDQRGYVAAFIESESRALARRW